MVLPGGEKMGKTANYRRFDCPLHAGEYINGSWYRNNLYIFKY